MVTQNKSPQTRDGGTVHRLRIPWPRNPGHANLIMVIAIFILVSLVASVYMRTAGFNFVNYDDDQYVYNNPIVRRGLTNQGLSWAFTTFHISNWHPLTWLSHMADIAAFGLRPGFHHMVNIAIHVLNSALCFAALRALTGNLWPAFLAAVFFAVHPLHVESVAWISGRKDLLSALFFFPALLAWRRYLLRPGLVRYAAAAAAMAAGLLAKPMLVTLPLVLLCLDWWPLGRFHSGGRLSDSRLPPLAAEKLPLFLLAAASAAVTSAAQHRGGSMAAWTLLPFGARLANAVISPLWYMFKTILPTGLAAFYPFQFYSWPQAAGAAAVLAVLTASVLYWRRRPYLAAGWLFFLVMLLPVVGLIQVGDQGRADRYTYLPLIGLFMALAWGAAELLRGRRFLAPAALAAAVAATAALACAAWTQTGYWRDSKSLFTRAASVTEDNYVAWHNLGEVSLDEGNYETAAAYYRRALDVLPQAALTHLTLGLTLAYLNRVEEAEKHLAEALRLNPSLTEAQSTLNMIRARRRP